MLSNIYSTATKLEKLIVTRVYRLLTLQPLSMVIGVPGRTGAPAARHVMTALENESASAPIRHLATTGNLAQAVDPRAKCVS